MTTPPINHLPAVRGALYYRPYTKLVRVPLDDLEELTTGRKKITNLPIDARFMNARVDYQRRTLDIIIQSREFESLPQNSKTPELIPEIHLEPPVEQA